MKNKAIIITSLALLTAFGSQARSPKRGVSENGFRFKAQLEVLAPGVGWYYTWGNTPQESLADYKDMDFIPMCWNGNFNTEGIREFYRTHPEVKYILGFNEPNFPYPQANMTPDEAAAKWPEVLAIAKEFGLEVVAPALNHSPGEWQPVPWMDRFIELVGKDAFDYLAIHSYGGAGVMRDLAEQMHERYGKDVWVTEFCYWPGESGYVAPATQIASMIDHVTWLEKTPWIKRYAWFKATGNYDSANSANYGLMKPGKGDDPRELTEQGYVYVYMTDFNPDVYHPTGTVFPATEYINSDKISLGKSSCTEVGWPIEVTRFDTGASLDYQIDVPAADTYTLRIIASGQGEPVRFDPCIAVYGVNADGTDGELLAESKRFALSGNDSTYTATNFTLSLKAGKQTIRLKDAAPYQPSGIRIAGISVNNTAGIGSITDADITADPAKQWFTLSGLRIDRPTAPGIYICRSAGKTEKVVLTR